LVFNKAGRHYRLNFKFNNAPLESVNEYKYLGIHFCASGSFSYAQEQLYKKGVKAYFKLTKDFLSMHPSVKTSMHMFDHTIKPILLYGCEIWACLIHLVPNLGRDNRLFVTFLPKIMLRNYTRNFLNISLVYILKLPI
jgi:hypothetical protein